MALNKATIAGKREVLESVKAQLKTEFFGLDEIIDKVIDSLSAWYIFPEIITRPVIVNLWGMTGVGKTQLIRRLVSLLDFSSKFVEVQMDGGSSSNYWERKLSSILAQSTIEEGTPGILLLDEIQRFRTVDEHGEDVKVESYQDVWTLLSDGRFSADSSAFAEIEMMILQSDFDSGKFGPTDEDDDEDERPRNPNKKRVMYPYEAKNLKKLLRLPEGIQEIMQWSTNEVMRALENARSQRTSWEIDYSKLVIFIAGNLDNAFVGATSTEDSDTDADFYHQLTKNISVNNIKEALLGRFRPEQISRLGNNHIIYPSMSKLSYQKLIASTCQKYTDEMTNVSGITFDVDQSVLDEIYDNSVFPTQGTRPVFSSIHKIFSTLLVNVAFWAIENDHKALRMQVTDDRKHIEVTAGNISKIFPVDLELNERKAKTSLDFKTCVGVHEVGHAVMYAILTKKAPFEVKINANSFRGGYMLQQQDDEALTKHQVLDSICVTLAGRAIEELVFGKDNITTGATSDIHKATEWASNYVRKFGFDGYIAHVDSDCNNSIAWVTQIDETNKNVVGVLDSMYARTMKLLTNNMDYVMHIADILISKGALTQAEFIQESKPFIELKTEGNSSYPFASKWAELKAAQQLKAA